MACKDFKCSVSNCSFADNCKKTNCDCIACAHFGRLDFKDWCYLHQKPVRTELADIIDYLKSKGVILDE
ncbi:MAG: hypothetical protein IJN85_04820 [Oscillospiraceae bacterium]|nr:hypothetical protein [Oscillospiraceae bacterium]